MNAALSLVGPGVWASLRAVALADVADLIVFDVDGVLVDVRDSYPWVITHAAQQFLHEVGLTGEEWAVLPDETTWFKQAGGFNSDWDLAAAVVLVYLVKAFREGVGEIAELRRRPPGLRDITQRLARAGGGLVMLERLLMDPLRADEAEQVLGRWNRRRIDQLCMEFYAGSDSPAVFGVVPHTYHGPGLMMREKALVTAADLPAGFTYGLYTGRAQGETEQALKLLGLRDVFDPALQITADSGIKKPDPEGLRILARRVRPRLVVYAGDNLDDWEVTSRYLTDRDPDLPPCLFAGILGGAPGPLAWNLFQDRGVELLAESARALLAWLGTRRAGRAG
jgi:phosphoglycolate phosphatase-like HAD superfamily hydrolase